MNKLKKLAAKGWMFCVWISPISGFIIQGKLGIDSDDFQFDVQAIDFNDALVLALDEVKRLSVGVVS